MRSMTLFISREGQEYLSKFVTRMVCAWVALTRSRLVYMTISREFSNKSVRVYATIPYGFRNTCMIKQF